MKSIGAKVAYVRSAAQTRRHDCHWPGCERQVPPAKWGCREHWYKLPPDLRSRIWRAYQIGQEQNGRPSSAYLAVAHEAQEWIRDYLARQADHPRASRQGALDL